MPVTNKLYFLNVTLFLGLVLATSSPALALTKDEDWLIIQGQHKFEDQTHLIIEYVRRNRDNVIAESYLDLGRFSVGKPISEHLTAYLGAAYSSFPGVTHENRLHQWLIGNWHIEKWDLKIFNRTALEERFFFQDPTTYLRLRNKIQLNFFSSYDFGLSLYDEALGYLNGHDKFPAGINENRFGIGLRANLASSQFFIFFTQATLDTIKAHTDYTWTQFLWIASF